MKIRYVCMILILIPCMILSSVFLSADHVPDVIQMEYLNRGTVAMMTEAGVFVSWRLLGTEAFDTVFHLFRNGEHIAMISDSTNYLDPDGTMKDRYTVSPESNLDETENSDHHAAPDNPSVDVWPEARVTIMLKVPEGGTSEEGERYTYSPNDATCADLDGDGEYEILLKWDPSNAFDSALPAKHTGNVYIDAYRLSGEWLWRIDLGCNISAGAHFTQMAAYDFDLDGKAELVLKTAPGSVDGTGRYVSEASQIPEIRQTDNLADYRGEPDSHDLTGGRVLNGDEYLTVFEGMSGKAMDTVFYPYPRGDVASWGDAWGNRSERYLTAVAYLDGVHPHVIAWRGYYARTAAAAYRLIDHRLVRTVSFDSAGDWLKRYGGQGNHNLAVADVDQDGRDEILCGSLALDHDLSVLWCSGRGHGDVLHLADYDPEHEGLEYFCVHETAPFGMTVYDAATGKTLFHADGERDTGRGMMAHTGFTDGYFEIWGTYEQDASEAEDYAGCYVSYGNQDFAVAEFVPGSQNFRIYWDSDLLDELMDGDGTPDSPVRILKKKEVLATFPDTKTVNGTKQNVCLQADLFGDWREEFAVPSSDGTRLYVYTTTVLTQERVYTLMHDRAYRMQVAAQNAGYNQSPHPGYYLSDNGDSPDARKDACNITTVHNGTVYRREYLRRQE